MCRSGAQIARPEPRHDGRRLAVEKRRCCPGRRPIRGAPIDRSRAGSAPRGVSPDRRISRWAWGAPGWSFCAARCAGRSRHGDHDLAEGAAFADVGEGLGNVVEPERTIDVDANVTSQAEVGQRLEVGRSFLDGEDPDPSDWVSTMTVRLVRTVQRSCGRAREPSAGRCRGLASERGACRRVSPWSGSKEA